MAGSDTPRLVELVAGDAEEAMALSVEAGWNQVAEDWRHFIEHGRTFAYRDDEGRLIATAAALPYDGAFGFIGMVIVTGEQRRKGLATRLVDLCIAELEAQGRVPVLDATEQGELVYRRQGFVPQLRFDRWQSPQGDATPEIREGRQADKDVVARLDEAAFGAGRAGLMQDFLSRGDTVSLDDGDDAFALIRRGRRAWQAGPVVAGNEYQAIALLDDLLEQGMFAFIDVPQRWSGIGEWLRARGYSIQRSFARMALGRSEPFGAPERLFAMAGPEFG